VFHFGQEATAVNWVFHFGQEAPAVF